MSSIAPKSLVARERFYRPQSLAAAAELMRQRITQRFPLIAGVCREIGRSGLAFAVDRGQDAIIYQARDGETLDGIRRKAGAFASRYGIVLRADQTDENIVSQSIISGPGRLQSGDEIYIYTSGRATGQLEQAREIISKMTQDQLEPIFGHHLLDSLFCVPLDCLARAFADLGIVREDFHQLNWLTADARARNVRRWAFTANPDLAQEIALAERCLTGGRAWSARVMDRLSDLRLSLLERLQEKNKCCWGLSVDHLNRAIAEAFPFINDPFFDAHQMIYSRCRRKTFQSHEEGAFLADVYVRMIERDSDPVGPAEIERAQQLVLAPTFKQIEGQIGISHHVCDELQPKPTLRGLFRQALAVILGDKLPEALEPPKNEAARRAEFASHVFSERYPKLYASLARMSLGATLASADYDRMFELLVVKRAETIAQLNRELGGLLEKYGKGLRTEHVQYYCSLAVRYSLGIFEIFGSGMTCDDYLRDFRAGAIRSE